MQSWHLTWAPHVIGTLSEKDEDTGAHKLYLICTICKDKWRTYCYSGKPGKRIAKFAVLHFNCKETINQMMQHAGYETTAKVNDIRYKIPSLSKEGDYLNPKGHWTPVIDPENIAYYTLFRQFNKNHYLSPRLPVDMGYLDTASLMKCDTNVLRMPIKFPYTTYRIPQELKELVPLITRVAEYESFINPNHELVFAHITFDKSSVRAGETHRFPGFHGDGFQGTKLTPKIVAEHSYIVTTNPPTEYCLQPFFLNHLDEAKHNMFLEFDKQAKKENIYKSLPNHLYLIDPYMVHRTPEIKQDTERLFIRITYTFSELEHPKILQILCSLRILIRIGLIFVRDWLLSNLKPLCICMV